MILRNSLILNLRYIIANKSDEVRCGGVGLNWLKILAVINIHNK